RATHTRIVTAVVVHPLQSYARPTWEDCSRVRRHNGPVSEQADGDARGTGARQLKGRIGRLRKSIEINAPRPRKRTGGRTIRAYERSVYRGTWCYAATATSRYICIHT